MLQKGDLLFLSGGTGTPKLLQGFRTALKDDELLTVIGNTGDDDEFYGLLVSPDIDTLLYLFAGILDQEKYWGIKGDSFTTNEFLKSLGEEAWFQLGDKDLALHLVRKKLLLEGRTLTAIVAELIKRLHIKATILPMTDDKVRTSMVAQENDSVLTFQEYTVKKRENVTIKDVVYLGSATAKMTRECLKAIHQSKMIIIGPSNPITSIGPMLAIPGFKEALCATKATILAVSPIVEGKTFSGPAARLMKELGSDPSPVGIAKLYKEFLDILVISTSDSMLSEEIQQLGIQTICASIDLSTEKQRVELAQKILAVLKNKESMMVKG